MHTSLIIKAAKRIAEEMPTCDNPAFMWHSCAVCGGALAMPDGTDHEPDCAWVELRNAFPPERR